MNYMFYYLIDLHYSQTPILEVTLPRLFYYLIDLHYSQTLSGVYGGVIEVLLPYRFTLFSNIHIKISAEHTVLLPYRFTLFSNRTCSTINVPHVLLPYRFTLFSN